MELAVLLHSLVTSRLASCYMLCFRLWLEIIQSLEASEECSSHRLIRA